MGTPTWVIPVASLGAICLVALVFVWWWFPRTWKKGTAQEMKIQDDQRLERIELGESAGDTRTWQQQVIARALARERGEDLANYEVTEPPPPYVYKGPVV